ncbi:MAG TPA: TrbI/VirB10 family protein [Novosphingobium sp.]|nr:TrbI/VirB10 family protein [Novosphingobium sp.]
MAEPFSETAPAPHDVRPLVARASGNRALWLVAAILLAGGGGMFYALQMRRLSLESPSLTSPQGPGETMIASPPELAIPAAPDFAVSEYPPAGATPAPYPIAAVTARQPARQQNPAPYTAPVEAAAPPAFAAGHPAASSEPSVSATPSPGFAYQAPAQVTAQPDTGETKDNKARDKRAEAGQLRNPSTTVPQGSVIQAVMETALDSTRAGFARAIVSRDVTGFDGTKVLIPKGSKLFGEYQADVSLGQNRALIQWHRLTRPDGAIIDLDSPSADPLGRAGVRGRVNTHFLQRFSGAILQSMLDLGVRAATTQAVGNTYVLALPGTATQVGSTSLQNQADIKPTLKIRQGASVSVFVARDLDFTSVGG